MKFKRYTRCYFKKASLPLRCKAETYTYHTWMSLLVPVIEMMFGVTRHSLSFNIWRQTQLCKTKKVKKLKVKLRTAQTVIQLTSVLPSGMLFFTTLSTRPLDPPTSGCKKVPWPILSGGRFNSRSDSSSCDGTCDSFGCNVRTLTDNMTTDNYLRYKCCGRTSERCSDNFNPQFLALCKAGSRSLPWPTLN